MIVLAILLIGFAIVMNKKASALNPQLADIDKKIQDNYQQTRKNFGLKTDLTKKIQSNNEKIQSYENQMRLEEEAAEKARQLQVAWEEKKRNLTVLQIVYSWSKYIFFPKHHFKLVL